MPNSLPKWSVGWTKKPRVCKGHPLISMVNENGVKKVAEIGVSLGALPRKVVPNTKLEEYWCVDPWKPYTEFYHRKPRPEEATDEYWERVYQSYLKNTAHLGDVIRTLRMKSVDAASMFKEGSLDLVYIDSIHDYHHGLEDIRCWLPKIREGGVIGGHDYSRQFSGMVKAVDQVFGEDFELLGSECWSVVLAPGKKAEYLQKAVEEVQ